MSEWQKDKKQTKEHIQKRLEAKKAARQARYLEKVALHKTRTAFVPKKDAKKVIVVGQKDLF